jgi:hypothetical protein
VDSVWIGYEKQFKIRFDPIGFTNGYPNK